MDSTALTLFLGCILLLSVEITPFIGAQPVPGVGSATGGDAAGGAPGGGTAGGGVPDGGATCDASGGGAPGAPGGGAAGGGVPDGGVTCDASGGGAPGAPGGGAAGGGAPGGETAGGGAPGGETAGGGVLDGGATCDASGGGAPGAPDGGASGGGSTGGAAGAGAPGAAPGAGTAAAVPGVASDVCPSPAALASANAPGTSAGNASADGYKIANATGPPIVPCYFIFGDSLADSGNNNNLVTLAKANYPPYGVDYPAGPTGRFTNGRTYVDFLAEFLGFDHHIPPHAAAKSSDKVLQGLNYASAAAGIRPETGKIVGDRITLDVQLENHRGTVAHIKELKGNVESAARDYVGKCLYTVGIGSNDYMLNYLVTPANPKDVFTPDAWAAELARRIHDFLKNLYDLGARKVAVYGLGPIGCEPSQVKPLRMAGKPGCVDNVNHIVSMYNQRLPAIIDEHNKVLPGAKFTFINSSHITPGDNPARIGIKVGDQPCCQPDPVAGSCVPNSVPCPERGDYSFFDNYHPTEKAMLPWAKRAWEALEPQDTHPMDISHLARLP